MKQLLINSEELQVRVAVVEDGTLQDFFMERTNKDRLVGSIYKGKIKNLEPSLQAAFVDIGVGKNAFLHYWDMLPATLEKLEGEEDDEPVTKPGQERAEADMLNTADETDDYNPPAPPRNTNADPVEEAVIEQAAPADNMDSPAAVAAGPAEVPVEEAVAAPAPETPESPAPVGEAAPLAKGLLPLNDKKPGLIPLSKPQAPVAVPKTTAETQSAPAPAEADAPATPTAPVTTQIEINENPAPLPEREAAQGGQPRPPRQSNNGPRPQQQAGGNGTEGGNGNGGHRNRNRRRRSGNRFANAAANSPQAAASKPGAFRRLLEIFLPFLKHSREAAAAQSRQQSRQQNAAPRGGRNGGEPLSVNAGKPDLLPLTPGQNGGKTPSGDARQGQQPRGEKPAKNDKPQPQQPPQPKKPEKKGPTVEDIPNLFHVDQEILVQVTKGPIGTKGARVTTNLSIPGRYLVLLPNSSHVCISKRVENREERSRLKQMIRTILPPDMGVICRTEGAGITREHFQRDLQMLTDAMKKAEQTAATRRAPVCVYQEPALVERTLRDSLTQDIDEIVCDNKEDFELAQEMLKRFDRQDAITVKLYTNPTPIFIKYGISQQIEGLSNRKVPLPGGGYLCIDETEALIAIDVNTGKNRSGKDQPETILSTNLEAVKEIARQLRLRNIGGLVVLDLIDMRSKKDQMTVYRAFKEYTAQDHARIKIYPISGLGLLEMSRQRESESLESTIYEDCPYCKGRGLIKTATSVSVEIQRRLNELLQRKKDVQHFVVTVHPKILERLRTADHKVMNAMAAEYNRQLTFNADASLHIEAYHIANKETGAQF